MPTYKQVWTTLWSSFWCAPLRMINSVNLMLLQPQIAYPPRLSDTDFGKRFISNWRRGVRLTPEGETT